MIIPSEGSVIVHGQKRIAVSIYSMFMRVFAMLRGVVLKCLATLAGVIQW